MALLKWSWQCWHSYIDFDFDLHRLCEKPHLRCSYLDQLVILLYSATADDNNYLLPQTTLENHVTFFKCSHNLVILDLQHKICSMNLKYLWGLKPRSVADPDGWRQTQKGDGNLLFGQHFLKTAWKWRIVYRRRRIGGEGEVPLILWSRNPGCWIHCSFPGKSKAILKRLEWKAK